MVAEATLAELALEGPAPDGPTISAHPEPMRAIHNSNFPALLRQLGISLLVTESTGHIAYGCSETWLTHFGIMAPQGGALCDGSRCSPCLPVSSLSRWPPSLERT
jgi:hypothetical protein